MFISTFFGDFKEHLAGVQGFLQWGPCWENPDTVFAEVTAKIE
jgi:hypothetical protein